MDEYISKSNILQRNGWTAKAISLFLKTHDREAPNPYYKSAPPMRLYLMERVLSEESKNDFNAFVEKNSVRVNSAKKSNETKRNNIIQYIESIKISVPNLSKESLLKAACNSYNNWQCNKDNGYDGYGMATTKSDEHFLKRITLNYLRHELTSYEKELDRIYGKVGVRDAYELLKTKINKAIINKYKWLE